MSGHEKEVAKQDSPSFVTAAAGEIIAVEVGPTRERFLVHKALLVHHSEYFAAAIREPWKDTQDGVVLLHDVEPSTCCSCTSSIPTLVPDTQFFKDWSSITDHAPGHSMLSWLQDIFLFLIKAYVFGDKYLATRFRQDVNQEFSNHLRWNCLELPDGWRIIEYAFKNVPLDRPIVQHLADDHCNFWAESDDDEIDIQAQKRLPRYFLMRVNRRFAELGAMNAATMERLPPRCYYEHASDKEKEKCGKSHMVYNEEREHGYFPEEP